LFWGTKRSEWFDLFLMIEKCHSNKPHLAYSLISTIFKSSFLRKLNSVIRILFTSGNLKKKGFYCN
ncbi:MAG: hypothetical protein ACPHOK_08775, partial [Akkermansiaceae bacterium]